MSCVSRFCMLALAIVASAPAISQVMDDQRWSAPPEPTLAAYRSQPGIDPAVWKLTDQAGASLQEKQAKAPRTWQLGMRTVRTTAPEKPLIATMNLRLTPVGEGFVIRELDGDGEMVEAKGTELSLAGVLAVHEYQQAKMHIPGIVGGPADRRVIRSLTTLSEFGLKLADLKPGYRWLQGGTVEVEVRVRAALASRDNKQSVSTKTECEAEEGGAASAILSELTGAVLKVTCRSLTDAAAASERLYFDDYALFVLMKSRTKLSETEYKILGVKK